MTFASGTMALTQLVALYGHLVDDGQFDRLDEVFRPDSVVDLGAGVQVAGLAAIQAWLADRPQPRGHFFANVLVSMTSADTAVVRSSGLIVRTDGSLGVVRFTDAAVKTASGWRVARRDISVRP